MGGQMGSEAEAVRAWKQQAVETVIAASCLVQQWRKGEAALQQAVSQAPDQAQAQAQAPFHTQSQGCLAMHQLGNFEARDQTDSQEGRRRGMAVHPV